MDKIAEKIAKKIYHQRQVSGLTAKQVAEKADMSRSTFSNVENGNQQVYSHDLWKIAKALNCSIGELYPDEELEKIKERDNRAFTKNWEKKLK